MKTLVVMAFLLAAGGSPDRAKAEAPANDAGLSSLLEPIRAKYRLPALAGGIVTVDGLVEAAAVGTRKAGTTVAVTPNDLWHLGSDTKAMTALLAGTFVVQGKLSWDDKVISFFPEVADRVPEAMKNITVAQMLRHEAGLAANYPMWRALLSWGPLPGQRRAVAEWFLKYPDYAPGAFHYSNGDYIVMGTILEKLGGKPWEELMRERIFVPLHMDSAGFGGTGTVGQIDEPWPHFADGSPAPSNGPDMDNLPYMGPCGSVHCSLADWGKFLADQLRGAAGRPALLPPAIYHAMQTPLAGSAYGFGWGAVPRSWSGGNMLEHAGSNTMNYALVCLAPAKGFGVIVCTNEGGDAPAKATDEAAWALVQAYQLHVGRRSP